MDIGLIVADIVKPTLTEPLGKKARFVASGDVCRGAGAEPAGKKSEMARDSGYETFVAGRCEIDWRPASIASRMRREPPRHRARKPDQGQRPALSRP
jgi:hypothetical protein